MSPVEACDEAVDLLRDGVEVEARPVRRRHAELRHQRLAAVVAGADRDCPHVVSSSFTDRIMWPPRLNGAIRSSSSARPHSAPTLVGPHILCDENARKSQPSSWTSTA